MYKNTYLDDPLRETIIQNSQYASVTRDEACRLAEIAREMFQSNGIPYEVQQAVHSEKSPEVSVMFNKSGITLKIGVTCKKTTVTRLTPKGGGLNEYL